MKKNKIFFLLTSLFLFNISIASENQSYVKLAATSYTSFMCSNYAMASGKNEKANKLNQNGMKAGQNFLKALENGDISGKSAKSEIPFIVLLVISEGGSLDFMLGRIFELAHSDARDNIMKKNLMGLPMPEKDWRLDIEERKSFANLLYEKSNCWVFEQLIF